MKITKRGLDPKDKLYTGECLHCGTEVEFERSEAKLTPDQRDGDYLSVQCPVCSGQIHTGA